MSGNNPLHEPFPLLPPDCPVTLQGMTDEQSAQLQPAGKCAEVPTTVMGETHDFEILPTAPAKSILEEAARITSGDRNKTYGPPRDNHSRTAAMWEAYLSGLNGRELDYRDVCWLNVLQKASRDVFHRQRDNLTDGCGFLRNIEMAENDEGR